MFILIEACHKVLYWGLSCFFLVNDIRPNDPENNILVKFAHDMTVSAPVKTTGDTAFNEVKNISDWANENKMILNFSKTWEIVISKG